MSRSYGLLLILWITKKCTPPSRRLICAFDLTELSLLWDGRRFNLYCVRVAFAFLVFCGSRCCYYRWIYYRSLFQDQSFCCELLYHLWKKLFLQLVFWDGSLFFTAPRSVVYWSSQYSCRHCSIFFLYSAGENPVTCLNCREKNFSSS